MDTVLVIVIALVAAALAGALGFVVGSQRGRAADDDQRAEATAARLRVTALERDAEALRAETASRVQEERVLADRRVA
ncbi:hypothetical protein, partial [Microbacterium sp.]|uniref:hypothetical protein n=1 Tax=Microbacterium sp. TaxID=51671 RepID=UPI0028A62C56